MMDHLLKSLADQHNIVIGQDLDIASDIKASNFKPSTIIIVTDKNLELLHLPKLKFSITSAMPQTPLITFAIPPGEASKSRATKEKIEDFLLEHHCDRQSYIIAFGGGVIGDLVGFTASTFLRGIALLHIPTTLLAMVDSSVGWKTGVDTPHGKNLIGTFYEARRNYINLSFLKTLPPREFYNGCAEIIKMACTGSATEFERLESSIKVNPSNLESMEFLASVTNAIQYKTSIATSDARETKGMRNLLNFGHTIGHAIETLLSPALLHGECVALGMILETKIAIRLGHCKRSALERLTNILTKYKLPTALAKVIYEVPSDLPLPSVEKLIEIMYFDKKNSQGSIHMVLLSDIGSTAALSSLPVPREEIEKVLSEEMNGLVYKCLNSCVEQKVKPVYLTSIPPATNNQSFFLCMTLSDYAPYASRLLAMAKGVDVVEIRVDLVRHPPNFEFSSAKEFQEFLSFVSDQVKTIRKQLPNYPIIYTPRTVSHGGQMPDAIPLHIMKAIYMLGFYVGCEIVDVQIDMPQEIIDKVCQLKKETGVKVIASNHKLDKPLNWTGQECMEIVETARSIGDIIKIVSIAISLEDNDRLEEFTGNYWGNIRTASAHPLIAINAGSIGEMSRVRNRYMTPVTSTDLPTACPGQLTAEQIRISRSPEVYY